MIHCTFRNTHITSHCVVCTLYPLRVLQSKLPKFIVSASLYVICPECIRTRSIDHQKRCECRSRGSKDHGMYCDLISLCNAMYFIHSIFKLFFAWFWLGLSESPRCWLLLSYLLCVSRLFSFHLGIFQDEQLVVLRHQANWEGLLWAMPSRRSPKRKIENPLASFKRTWTMTRQGGPTPELKSSSFCYGSGAGIFHTLIEK